MAAVALAPTTPVATPAAIRFGHVTRITGTLTDAGGMPQSGAVAQLQQTPTVRGLRRRRSRDHGRAGGSPST